jgi:hypothetical protein
MRTFLIGWACLAAIAAMVAAAGNRASAQADPAAEITACGQVLSPAVSSAWRGVGGEAGRLGCPTEKESASTPSRLGSASRVAVFGPYGEIVLHVSGPRAGQAFVVGGCFYRLYVEFGGTDGWLGLPVGDAENTPDGSRQSFEGGSMRYARALDECQATPSAAPAAEAKAADQAAETALDLFEDPASGERLSLAAAGSVERAIAGGYRRLRAQARVLTEARPGAVPLKLYRNEDKALYETLASVQSERDALDAGFTFQAGQGYVWADPRPGAVSLKLYRDQASGRARLTAGETDEREAAEKGYAFVRVEGYADPAP